MAEGTANLEPSHQMVQFMEHLAHETDYPQQLLFVRGCYSSLLAILRAYQAGDTLVKFFYFVGTPGVGKSYFGALLILYFLVVACFTVIYVKVDKSGDRAYHKLKLHDPPSIVKDTFTVKLYLNEINTVYCVDGGAPGVDSGMHQSRVFVFASPKKEHFQDLKKRQLMSKRVTIPEYPLDEAKQLLKLVPTYRYVEREVESLYALTGGVMRRILEAGSADKYRGELTRIITELKEHQIEDILANIWRTDTNGISDMLFHIRMQTEPPPPRDASPVKQQTLEPFLTCCAQYATPMVASMIACFLPQRVALKISHYSHKALTQEGFLIHAADLGYQLNQLEMLVHMYGGMRVKPPITLRLLDNEPSCPVREWTVQLPASTPAHFTTCTDLMALKNQECSTYAMPVLGGFKAIDSAVSPVIWFQSAKDTEHHIDYSNVQELLTAQKFKEGGKLVHKTILHQAVATFPSEWLDTQPSPWVDAGR
ncbi:hypothetical protein WJX72_003567 [[Myrmecia] bisecta]|uniref:Uncharacterized protein n=1 Tax=[Myrmecia] bisecta TaxID=41462 RepID=A0AAW1R5F8_9CHLO